MFVGKKMKSVVGKRQDIIGPSGLGHHQAAWWWLRPYFRVWIFQGRQWRDVSWISQGGEGSGHWNGLIARQEWVRRAGSRRDLRKINREQWRSHWGTSHLLHPESFGHLSISLDNCGLWFREVKTQMFCFSGLRYGLSLAAAHRGFGPGGVDFPLTLPKYSHFVSNVLGELPLCSSQALTGCKKCTVWTTAGLPYGPSLPIPVLIGFLAVGVHGVITSPSSATMGDTFEGIKWQYCWV